MGRHHKKRSKLKSGVSEEREQKKIRENILKVFQACVATPGQGGALLVGKSQEAENIKHKGEKRKKFGRQCRDVGDDGSTDSMSSHGKKAKAVSLSGRKRSKKSNKKEIEKETALSRHMRVAHAISDPQIQDKAKGGVSMYTHGRITQKVGLIRTGKKGAPASRGMVIPEHVSREIDKEVRKLVLEAEADMQPACDVDVAERLVLSSRYSAGSRQSKTLGSSDVRQPLSTIKSVERLRGKNIPLEDEHFPEALQLRETVNEVMISMKPVRKTLYPGKDKKRETHIELMKLYKQQNAQMSETPTRLPVFSNITSSGTVQKSLNKSFADEVPHQHHYQGCQIQEKSSTFGLQTHQKQKPNDQAYSFDNHDIFSVPQINFSDINPFQPAQYGMSLSHKRHENSHQRLPVTNSLGSYKRLRQDVGDNLVDMNNNNVQEICMDISCRDKHWQMESLDKCYSTSKLLDYSRQKLLDEIRTYMCKHNQSKEVKNLKTEVRDEFTSWLETEISSDEKDVNHIDYFGVKTSGDDDFFLSGSRSNNMPQSPVLHSRRKVGTPISPTLSMDARELLRANHELKGTSEVFEAMEVDTRDTGEAVGLLVKNDLVQTKTERQQQHLNKTARNILDDMFDNKLEDRSRNNSQCSQCSQCSSGRSSQVQVPKQPNYMPSFHDNYYPDQMATGDLSWQQKNSRAKVEAMDILDYAEEQQGPSSHIDCQGDRSSASDGLLELARSSSMWSVPGSRVTAPPLPLSPGGPKFYPKKLY